MHLPCTSRLSVCLPYMTRSHTPHQSHLASKGMDTACHQRRLVTAGMTSNLVLFQKLGTGTGTPVVLFRSVCAVIDDWFPLMSMRIVRVK